MIAVILFFVVIIATAILLGNWATKLDKREKELKKEESRLQVHLAQVRAMMDSARKKQKDADDAWQKCLEEGDRLMKKQHELEAREAEIEAKEARLKQVSAQEAPDIIEPVEDPQKVAFGTAEKKRCPRCGKEMKMLTDYVRTTEPPQFQYVCPECGYEEVDTCPPTHNLVGTDKKPVKKARKGGKK